MKQQWRDLLFLHWPVDPEFLRGLIPDGLELDRGDIHHAPWPLPRSEVEIHKNPFLDHFPVGERHPSILFSKSLDVVVFPLEKLT